MHYKHKLRLVFQYAPQGFLCKPLKFQMDQLLHGVITMMDKQTFLLD